MPTPSLFGDEEWYTPNHQLAHEYFKAATQCSSGWLTYVAVRNAMIESEIDLRAYFLKHGSFRGCKIPGLGQKTYDLLTRIIREGVSVVVEHTVVQREEDLRPKPGNAIATSGGIADMTETGELHNAIRAMEEDRY